MRLGKDFKVHKSQTERWLIQCATNIRVVSVNDLWVAPIGFPPRKVAIGTVGAGVIQTKGHGEDERQWVYNAIRL